MAVAGAGVGVPFPCGFALGEFLPQSLLPGAATARSWRYSSARRLSISSIKVVAMVVREMNFMRRDLGQVIVASAIMEDTVGWVIIAVTLGIASGGLAIGPLSKTLIGTALFLIVSFAFGRRVVFLLIRWVNDHCVSEYATVTAILIVMLLMALLTQLIGVNTVLGAFIAGVLIGDSPILSGRIDDQLRGFITAFLMPIFFGLSGLSADLTVLRDPTLAALTVGLVAIASIGKFAGAFVGGRLSGLSGAQALAVGCGMNARGSTEVVVATIGLSVGALSQQLYTMIVVMAVITTMAMPPMLRWALGRLPMERDEAERLEQEEIDAKGFVSKFERLLIAADDGANGKLAARLAGTIGGRGGLPLTVLDLSVANGDLAKTESPLVELVRHSAAASATFDREEKPRMPEVTARADIGDLPEAVAEEAGKGFDLLFVGIDRMSAPEGGFSTEVDRIAGSSRVRWPSRSAAPTMNAGSRRPSSSRSTARKRPAAAPSWRSPWPPRRARASWRSTCRNRPHAASAGPAAPPPDTAWAERRWRTSRRWASVTASRSKPPCTIIPRRTRRSSTRPARAKADLVVMGASRRVGDKLFLGKTAAAVAAGWPGCLVLLAA